MGAGGPGFEWILAAQSLSAVGEVFGQRQNRRSHGGSVIRSLTALTVYSAIQAFVVLAVCELALPTEWTRGQGSLWMWGALWEHPALLVNAFNNTVYWIALVLVLREPLGAVLVVLAFVLASFFIAPFEAVVGLDSGSGVNPWVRATRAWA